MLISDDPALLLCIHALIHALPLASLALLAVSAQAATVWTESINGDLSSSEAAPTPLVFALGSNVINGSVGSPDSRDYITFNIGPGQSLGAINLLFYDDLNTGAANDGNRGFHAINLGNPSYIPSESTTLLFLGGDHLDPLIGSNLLPNLASGAVAGTGFTGLPGTGTYSYLVQQTGPQLTGYSIEFVIVPEPSSALLLSLAGAGVAFRRRR